jgi:dihydroneopterin aldolase
LSDDLNDTVDYVLLNKIVVEEMEIRSHLLEHVAQRIITRVFGEILKFPEYFWEFQNKSTYWW